MAFRDDAGESRRRFRDALLGGGTPAGADAEVVERGAEEGDAEAQYLQGLWRQRQYQDPYRGVGWLERAAVQGHGEAAKALAEFHRGQLADVAPSADAVEAGRVIGDAARHWYVRAADAGLAVPDIGRQVPAWALSGDAPVDGTWPAIRRRLEALADRGQADAAYRIGVALCRSGTRESPEPWLRRAAERGHREAMHALGSWHLEQFDEEHFHEVVDPRTLPQPLSADDEARLEWQESLGAPQRAHLVAQAAARDLAVRWLAAAAERGDVEAAVELADFLGRSGPSFEAQAARWTAHAAGLGDTLSMVSYARILERGAGVPADAEAAREWYARGAEALEEASRQEDAFAPFALCQLAELSLRGRGVALDVPRALALYEQAAASGHHWAMLSLGDLYERGDGVARDLARAEEWFARAVEAGGNGYARSRLESLRATRRHEAETVEVDGVRVPREVLRRAETGDARAMSVVASTLEMEGALAPARRWLERAALAGDATAAFTLFLQTMGDDGIGETARAWRRRAAAAGHVTALHMIGEDLLDPDAGTIDFALGYAWLVMASRERHAHPPSVAPLQRASASARARDVWESLSPDERARAQAIVASCDDGPPFRLPDEVGSGLALTHSRQRKT